jgi:hypothetical protein
LPVSANQMENGNEKQLIVAQRRKRKVREWESTEKQDTVPDIYQT